MAENKLNIIREWRIENIGDIFMFGRKGAGKTCKLLTLTQAMYDKKIVKKVWDIYGGERMEGPFWAFPNKDDKLWRDLERETYELKSPGPKQYKVRLLYPMFSKTLPKKLPYDMPNVDSKVFTIPIKDFDRVFGEYEHLGLVLGKVGPQAKSAWSNLMKGVNDNSNGEDLKELLETKYKGMLKTAFYSLFLEPLVENHFLSSEKSPSNLDVLSEAEDLDRISILCLDYVPETYHYLVMAYLVQKVYNLARHNKTHKKHFMLFREASRFMKVVDENSARSETSNVFRNVLVDIVRYGRSGVYFGLDTQDSCISEDTEIKIFENGKLIDKKIKDISENTFKIPTYDVLKKKFTSADAEKIYSGEQTVYEIELENDEKIYATKNHRFFDKNMKEIYVEDLTDGKEIIVIDDKDIGRIKNISAHLGKKASDITKKKHSDSIKRRKEKFGYINSPETRMKMSENAKNNPNYGMSGKKLSEETKKKMMNIIRTEDFKNRISKSLIGRSFSVETRKKLSDKSRGRKLDDETKLKIRNSCIKSAENNPNWGWRTSRKKQIFPKKDSTIEIKIQNYLKQLNVTFFTHQYMKIEHGYQCDILIPSLNLVIECDGNYWHKYPIGRDIDNIRTNELINKGFKVLRIWEIDIRNMNLNEFRDKLNEKTKN